MIPTTATTPEKDCERTDKPRNGGLGRHLRGANAGASNCYAICQRGLGSWDRPRLMTTSRNDSRSRSSRA
eukprot:6547517-Lingulodinium_polyedra.AAC.1